MVWIVSYDALPELVEELLKIEFTGSGRAL
jgi:hypothetical protein